MYILKKEYLYKHKVHADHRQVFFFFLISQIPFSYGVFPPYEGPAAKVTWGCLLPREESAYSAFCFTASLTFVHCKHLEQLH